MVHETENEGGSVNGWKGGDRDDRRNMELVSFG